MENRRLTVGTRVEVRRIGSVPARGYILRGPLEYLAHIGAFYHVGFRPPDAEPLPAGRPRRGAKPRTVETPEFGMYDERDIKVLRGRPLALK